MDRRPFSNPTIGIAREYAELRRASQFSAFTEEQEIRLHELAGQLKAIDGYTLLSDLLASPAELGRALR